MHTRTPHLFCAAAAMAAAAGLCSAQPFVAQDDLVVGWSRNNPQDTIRLYDTAGQQKPDSWDTFGFVQSVTWDNTGGIGHNPMGNLIAGNFGTVGDGGAIYVYESGDGWAGVEVLGFGAGAQQTFAGLGLITTRLGGVSVSPDNTKIAFAGNDTSQVYVLDYDAGNVATLGVPSGRQSTSLPMPLVGGVTSGTAWLDNDTVLAASASGDIVAVNQATMTWQVMATVPGANLGGSQFTSIAYSPKIADYIYFAYSNFDSSAQITTNTLHVVDPLTWNVVRSIDLSISANTMREIALDSQGNLYFTTHGGIIQRIDDVRNPAAMTDNSSYQIGSYGASVPFSGIDVAHADNTLAPGCYADCDGNDILNIDDFLCFINHFAQNDPYADCDENGVHNIDDFLCFINEFAQGCP